MNSRWGMGRALGLGVALVITAGLAKPALADPNIVIPALDQAAAVYKLKAAADIDSTVAGVQQLVTALQNKDVAAARQAWINARVGWERSEIFTATLFRDLDAEIDSWPDAKSGFHAIEVKLFRGDGDVPPEEAQYLLDKVTTFQHLFNDQPFSGHEVMVGLASLAYEIGDSKAQGGESAASGTSLQDMQHNIEGLQLAWDTVFRAYLKDKPARGSGEIPGQIDALRKLVSVASLDQIDPAELSRQAEDLAASLADIAVDIGWHRPDYTDAD